MKRVAVLLLLFPLLAQAASSGSWSQQTGGGVLSNGNQVMVGKPVNPPAGVPAEAIATRISWRITPLSAPPPGLAIKLCNVSRCVPLDSLSGQRALPGGFAANGQFRFLYNVASYGQLRPVLNVVSQQLTVSYRTAG